MQSLQGDGLSSLQSFQGRKKRRPRLDGPFDKSAGYYHFCGLFFVFFLVFFFCFCVKPNTFQVY